MSGKLSRHASDPGARACLLSTPSRRLSYLSRLRHFRLRSRLLIIILPLLLFVITHTPHELRVPRNPPLERRDQKVRAKHLLGRVQNHRNAHLGLGLRVKGLPHGVQQRDAEGGRLGRAAEADGDGLLLAKGADDVFGVCGDGRVEPREEEAEKRPEEVDANVEEDDQDDGLCGEGLQRRGGEAR